MEIEVFAEGRVIQTKRRTAIVEIIRVSDLQDIKALSLVRVPKELKRLRDMFALQSNVVKNVDPKLMTYKDLTLSQEQKERKPLLASLSFIANIALMVLLAL